MSPRPSRFDLEKEAKKIVAEHTEDGGCDGILLAIEIYDLCERIEKAERERTIEECASRIDDAGKIFDELKFGKRGDIYRSISAEIR